MLPSNYLCLLVEGCGGDKVAISFFSSSVTSYFPPLSLFPPPKKSSNFWKVKAAFVLEEFVWLWTFNTNFTCSIRNLSKYTQENIKKKNNTPDLQWNVLLYFTLTIRYLFINSSILNSQIFLKNNSFVFLPYPNHGLMFFLEFWIFNKIHF